IEENIVKRLVEPLLVPAHAVGDIEAVLELAESNKEDQAEFFSNQLRKLILSALAGNEITQELELAEKNIIDARTELEQERKKVDAILSNTKEIVTWGNPCPKLPAPVRSMDTKSFFNAALNSLGDSSSLPQDKSETEVFNFLVNQLTANGLHLIKDN